MPLPNSSRNTSHRVIAGLVVAATLAVAAVAIVLLDTEPSAPPSDSSGPIATERTEETRGDHGRPADRLIGGETADATRDVTLTVADPEAASRSLASLGRGVFRGLVMDSTGQACAQAEVWYNGQLAGKSDRNGNYQIEVALFPIAYDGLRPRYPALIAHRSDLGASVPVRPPRGGLFDLTLQRDVEFTGHVWDRQSRRPVSGATVEATVLTDSGQVAFELRSPAPEGRYRILGIPRGVRVQLRASAPGYAMDDWRTFTSEIGEKGQADIEVGAAISIRGRFEPWPPPGMQGAGAVICSLVRGRRQESHAIQDDGSFEFEPKTLLRRPVSLTLFVGEVALWKQDVSNLWQHEEVADLGVLTLLAPGIVRGSLPLPPGVPVDRLEVLVYGVSFSRYPLQPDGTFVLEPVAPGSLTLTLARGELQLTSPFATATVAPGQAVDLGEVKLEVPLVFGQVVDAAGRPIGRLPNVELRQKMYRTDQWKYVASQNTDNDGFFLLAAHHAGAGRTAPEPYQVTIRAPGRLPASFAFPAQPTIHFRRVQLEQGKSLRGRLTDATGRPLAGWLLTAVTDEAESARPFDHSSVDGSFVVHGLEDRSYTLEALAPDGLRKEEFEARVPGEGLVELVVGAGR